MRVASGNPTIASPMNVSASERRTGLLRVLIAGRGLAALEAALVVRVHRARYSAGS
jgi:hypothetical protein